MLHSRILAACFLPLAIAAQTAQAPAPDAVTEWIRGSAIRLTTPLAGHGFDDMQPLAKVVGDARIVALGEATHGTREFFQLKHRMLEFLATQMGFSIFSIEANMPEAYRLNDFVLNGQGDPATLIKGMYFWTWDIEEVLVHTRCEHGRQRENGFWIDRRAPGWFSGRTTGTWKRAGTDPWARRCAACTATVWWSSGGQRHTAVGAGPARRA